LIKRLTMSQLTYQRDVVSLWDDINYDLPDNYLEKIQEHPFLNYNTGIGQSFYIIGDHYQNKVVYISSTIHDLLGIEHHKSAGIGTEFMLKIVHPDDHAPMAQSMKQAWDFIHTHDPEARDYFIVNLYLRLRKTDRTPVKVLHQIFTLLSDRNGNILLNRMLFTDISYLKLNDEVLCSVVDARTNQCWTMTDGEKKLRRSISFSPREQEILSLLMDGFTSKQIAEKLCLSFHTVRNHRKNMMKKTGANTTVAMIALARAIHTV